MSIDILIATFREIAEQTIPELNTNSFIQTLSEEIRKNKYDIQDQTFIETSLGDDRASFVESFIDLFEKHIQEVEDRILYLDSNEGKAEVITLFIKNIDYTVDFCYNAIISKQFSQT
ncbi:MAG: hypothetical protein GTO02_06765 [Candidatus Dadabacteria bacterium]|nr:hypothetical protein [Candidatus Dadabacteria bacterium]NIQ14101.1 hypothetical protein [Candidatus Dadabacteria bacterium]